MKRWEHLFNRRDVLKLGAQGGATLLMSGCTGGLLKSCLSGGSGSDSEFLKQYSPIDRTLGDEIPREFSGDRNQRPHSILWNLPQYLASRTVEGPDEEAQVVVVGGGVAGLFTAYTLRQFKPIVLEQADRFGGNAKGQSWRGVDYSLGAAYIDFPRKGTPMEKLYHELKLEEILVRRDTIDPVEYSGKLYNQFWEGETDPAHKTSYEKMGKFFSELVSEKERPFPFVPALSADQLSSLKHFDQWDLHTLISRAVGGKIPEQLETALEYYCWSTYAGSAKELSAPAGLNFLAQEAEPICVAAGGNSKIAERVLQRIVSDVGQKNLRPKSVVVGVKVEGDRTYVLYEDSAGKLRRIKAKAVVMSCPKFVVAKILDGIEPERLEAIRKLKYRSYMTANLLINKKMDRGPYDVFMIKDGKTNLKDVAGSQAAMNATDFVMANFAAVDAKVNVLTFYRAFPVDNVRTELNQPTAYAEYRKHFEAQIEKDILPLTNLKSSDIVDLRLSLWGHALPLAAQGIYRGDTIERLRKPFKDRVFFVEQDNWAYPSLQTGATDSVLLNQQIVRALS